MNQFFGYNAPFIGGNERVLSRQIDERIIKNDLLQLLLTAPGERVMRPDFGTNVRTFIFEQIDNTGLMSLRRSIKEAIAKFDRRVNVSQVNFNVEDNFLVIKILGTFALDRFQTVGGVVTDTDLLLELKIPTKTAGSTLS